MDCLKHFKIAMPSLWKCFNVNKICKDSTTKQDQQFHAMNNNIYVHTLNDLGSVTKHIQYTCTMPNSNYYTMPSAITSDKKLLYNAFVISSYYGIHKTKTDKNSNKEMKH